MHQVVDGLGNIDKYTDRAEPAGDSLETRVAYKHDVARIQRLPRTFHRTKMYARFFYNLVMRFSRLCQSRPQFRFRIGATHKAMPCWFTQPKSVRCIVVVGLRQPSLPTSFAISRSTRSQPFAAFHASSSQYRFPRVHRSLLCLFDSGLIQEHIMYRKRHYPTFVGDTSRLRLYVVSGHDFYHDILATGFTEATIPQSQITDERRLQLIRNA
jgi:hypothetical protein